LLMDREKWMRRGIVLLAIELWAVEMVVEIAKRNRKDKKEKEKVKVKVIVSV
jgi:hypothetical protein